MSYPWSTACLDWEDRLLNGRTLVPDLPLFEQEAARAVRIFNRLKLPDVSGKPTLEHATGDWFRDIVRALFGSYDHDAIRRYIQEVFLLVAKKNGKSTGAAAIMVTAIIINRRPEAEFLLIAPTKEIADISFRQASGMIKADPEVSKLFHAQRHIRTITHHLTGAVLQIKAADTDVITGGKQSGTLIDETHVFAAKPKAAEVFLEIRGALAARPDGFLIQITTQSKTPPAGVFRAELQTARAVRDGRIALPLLPVLYELPLRLSKDGGWKRRDLWRFVNPNMGKSVDETFLVNALLKAESEGKEQMLLLASQHFNVEIGLALQSDRWAGADFWEAAGTQPKLTLEDLLARCDVVVVGIDGGGLDDLLGLNVTGRIAGTQNWLSWSKAWAHKSVLELRKDIAPTLQDFAADGDLVIVETVGDDVRQVADIVEQVEESGLLAEKYAIGVDRVGIGQIVEDIVGRGLDRERIVGIPQGWELSGAIKTLERKVAGRAFAHSGSRMMNWCVGNAKAEPAGNAIRITKQAAGKAKIDPLVAQFMSTALMSKNPEAKRSIYEDKEAYEKAFGKDPTEDGGEAKPWSREILKDPRHPEFAEHKARLEAWLENQPDDD